MATKGTSVSQTKTTGNPRKQVTAEAQKYAREESKKFYSGMGKSILDAGIAFLRMLDNGRKIRNGTLKEKAEAAQEILEIDIAVINAAIHPEETWEGIKAEVKNTMDEKGGSYIAGYVAGDAMIGAVGGLIGKEAGVVDDMLRVSKGSTKTRKWEQIVEKLRTKKTTKSTGKTITGSKKAVGKGGTAKINPNEIRYSQSSVNGSSEITDSMKRSGWKGDPIDIVQMPDGVYTTIDNTRVVSARKAGIDVQATIHNYNDPLPIEYVERFTTKQGVPKTWGEAIEMRIGNQKASFRNANPFGSFEMENIK